MDQHQQVKSEWVAAVKRLAADLEDRLKTGNYLRIPDGDSRDKDGVTQWEHHLGLAQSHAADALDRIKVIEELIDLT